MLEAHLWGDQYGIMSLAIKILLEIRSKTRDARENARTFCSSREYVSPLTAAAFSPIFSNRFD
jgi:hypothetical protein